MTGGGEASPERKAAVTMLQAGAMGAGGEIFSEITAFMRYRGQGWEIPDALPDRAFTQADTATIEGAFKERYAQFFGRAVEGPEIEFVTWSVKAQDVRPEVERVALRTDGAVVSTSASRDVFDPASGRWLQTAIVPRETLSPGARVTGPAVIVERETSTVVTSPFDAVIQVDSTILLVRKGR